MAFSKGIKCGKRTMRWTEEGITESTALQAEILLLQKQQTRTKKKGNGIIIKHKIKQPTVGKANTPKSNEQNGWNVIVWKVGEGITKSG
jgi:hypothetical protein